MGTSVSTSQSLTSNPLSDIKPTLENSPTDYFVNESTSIQSGYLAKSVTGDANTNGTMQKATSLYGDSLTNSSLNYSLSGGSSIVDGGAIMAMFNLASRAIDMNSPVSILESLNQAKSGAAAQTGDPVEDTMAKIKDFITENKTLFILGGLVVGYLIYKGVSK